jgi:ribosomal protein L20A (L18A)
MIDIPTIAFIGLPLLTGCIGVGLGAWWQSGYNSEGYWKGIAEREEKRAADNFRKFVNAAKECNAIADSNARLASALAAKKDRLNRIVEAFEGQRSGTAKKAVKLAKGELA